MIPPPPATTLMLPDIHSIEFLDGYQSTAPAEPADGNEGTVEENPALE